MSRYERWTRRTERPLLVLAVLFLLVLGAPIVWPSMPAWLLTVVGGADKAIWAAFAVDYGVRLVLVDNRRRFIRTHKIELAAVAVPALRPLRLLRLVSVGQMLAQRGRRNIVAQTTRVVVASAVLMVVIAAVAILDAERGEPDANIGSFGDALWWAATTITTVGYGDRFPVTGLGRLIAIGLMMFGIALLGILTASIAAWFVRTVQKSDEQTAESVEAQVRVLEAKVDELLQLVRDRQGVA